MAQKNKSNQPKKIDKSQAFRKALRRMFKRKNAEQKIEEMEKIAAIGEIEK